MTIHALYQHRTMIEAEQRTETRSMSHERENEILCKQKEQFTEIL